MKTKNNNLLFEFITLLIFQFNNLLLKIFFYLKKNFTYLTFNKIQSKLRK